MDILPLDWRQFLEYLVQIAGAFLLTLPVGWEREQSTRIMGLRTFPLVAVASCAYVLIAIAVVCPGEDAPARIIQGLMTGIGFIGGGAILKEEASVRGTATAASVWMVGALGAAGSALLGYPIVREQWMPDVTTDAYPIVFGDMRGYLVLDRVGLSVQRLDELYAETNITLLLARRRVGGQLIEPWKVKVQKVSNS